MKPAINIPITVTTIIALFFFIIGSANLFAGDILSLGNGMTFEGKVLKIKACTIIFKANGKKYEVPVDDISYIKFENEDDKVYTSYLEMSQTNPDACLSGSTDAANFHGKRGGHFVLGFLFGPFAIIGTALANPTPYKGKETLYLSKNQDQFNDPSYLTCYRRKAKASLINSELLGWGTYLIILLII